jgi:peptide/nickel transport system substrate-binding protein
VPEDDRAVTFVLKRSQPAFLMLLASGMSPVYPCHVSSRDMRTRPIGTGPFKFAEFKPNEYIRVVKNPDYWKPGRPYLDGVEWTIIPNRSTQTLAFIAGKFDMSFPYEVTLQSMRDIQNQAPNAICEMTPTPVAMNLLVNRDAAPFNDPDIRRAMQLTIDRKSFLDIIAEGQGDINGAMQLPPAGLWGLPLEVLVTLPGYGPDVAANRAEARKLMAKHGYGPDHRLAVKVATRNLPPYRDPAILLIDQLKEIYIDGELEPVDTTAWFPKLARKDFTIGLNLIINGLDDPDQTLYENYTCNAEGNYDAYCNPELDKMVDQQSMQFDQEKRKRLVWEIEKKLAEDVARPILYHSRSGTCWHPYVKGYTMMVNSVSAPPPASGR